MSSSVRKRHATHVGAGILVSRLTGLARDIAVAAFLGTRLTADAYWAAIKIPNIIRNLLGEGTLSAAFVPVYSEQLDQSGEGDAPRRLASSVLGMVLIVATLLSGLGVLLAPWITGLLLGGADEATRVLTTSLVRILFPMSGFLILGAWCLGVLNSHDRFFLPFVAPALWNLSQVAGLLFAAKLGVVSLAHALAWSALVGAVLQVSVQVPSVLRLSQVRRPALELSWEPMKRVARNTLPVISSQGVFQVSSLVDLALASLAGTSALAALGYSQRLLYLPISLFGISVAAAALPAMSRETASAALRERLVNGFFQITFFVLPAAVVLLLFGDLAVGVVYERGEFTRESTLLVSSVLSAYSLGLVAMSSMKLFASGFHALQDTTTPMRIAVISVGVGVVVSVSLTLAMKAADYGPYSAMGLALGGAVGAWLNLLLHWWLLSRRIGGLFDRHSLVATVRLCVGVLVAAASASIARTYLEPSLGDGSFLGRLILLGIVLVAGGVPYLVIARRPPRLDVSASSDD